MDLGEDVSDGAAEIILCALGQHVWAAKPVVGSPQRPIAASAISKVSDALAHRPHLYMSAHAFLPVPAFGTVRIFCR